MFIKYKRYNFSFFLGILFFSYVGLIPSLLFGQNVEQGVQFYQQKNYNKAVSVLSGIKNAEAYLFMGKSFYALGSYSDAQANLNNISSDAPEAIYQEAVFTSALIHYQQKQFGDALSELYDVKNSNSGNLTENASALYRQVINYLSADQRQNAVKNTSIDEVKFDLLKSGLGKMDFSNAQNLYKTFDENIKSDEWKKKARKFRESLQNASAYQKHFGSPAQKLTPPSGTIYTIGVALPMYKPNHQEFGIIKAMYFGALLAADEFNAQNQSVKAAIHFVDTGTSASGIRSVIEQFDSKMHGDVLIGPLFSDQAEAMAATATDLNLPAIAPLANSDIHAENSFLYQANPTFKIHGKEMAEYAVNDLGLKNFAVLADQNSKGTVSAEAFRDEAEKLGANIQYFFMENLQSNNYELSKYTKRIGSSTENIDAIYAPFTGDAAHRLIDLLLSDIQTMSHTPVILGSQEYRRLDFHLSKYHNFNLYFSEGDYQEMHDAQIARFNTRYENKFGDPANKFSLIGYDVTRFILETLHRTGNPDLLKSAIATQPLYHGLIQNISFDGDNINKAVKILRVSPSGELTLQR